MNTQPNISDTEPSSVTDQLYALVCEAVGTIAELEQRIAALEAKNEADADQVIQGFKETLAGQGWLAQIREELLVSAITSISTSDQVT